MTVRSECKRWSEGPPLPRRRCLVLSCTSAKWFWWRRQSTAVLLGLCGALWFMRRNMQRFFTVFCWRKAKLFPFLIPQVCFYRTQRIIWFFFSIMKQTWTRNMRRKHFWVNILWTRHDCRSHNRWSCVPRVSRTRPHISEIASKHCHNLIVREHKRRFYPQGHRRSFKRNNIYFLHSERRCIHVPFVPTIDNASSQHPPKWRQGNLVLQKEKHLRLIVFSGQTQHRDFPPRYLILCSYVAGSPMCHDAHVITYTQPYDVSGYAHEHAQHPDRPSHNHIRKIPHNQWYLSGGISTVSTVPCIQNPI